MGPAAGPHDQLVQNIVLSWLAGSRIIELKTVQIMDELKIPRPCIDATNVGYNVEWSQELKLEQSLREYVGAMMFIEILKASRLLGDEFTGPFTDTIYDMSVGYSLEGIRSPRVRQWIESMKDARAIIDELRATLTGPWARYRDLPFPTRLSDTITLSTFHGCPAHEIEGIVTFLLAEMDVHVCIKLNPTLLGFEQVKHLLHDVLGYHDIQVAADAFEHDLQFSDALTMLPRLAGVARSPRQAPRRQVQQHAGGEEPPPDVHRRSHVHVRPAAARGHAEPGEEIPRAHGRRISHFVLRRARPAQRVQRRRDEFRARYHLHRPAAPRRLRAASQVPGKPGRENARAWRAPDS